MSFTAIFWVMFGKAVILAVWVSFDEARQAKKAEQLLLSRFKREWGNRRAKQPLMLTDQSPESL